MSKECRALAIGVAITALFHVPAYIVMLWQGVPIPIAGAVIIVVYLAGLVRGRHAAAREASDGGAG